MGGENGTPPPANFLSGIMKSVPPLNETLKMAGIQIPEYLGKQIEEKEEKEPQATEAQK